MSQFRPTPPRFTLRLPLTSPPNDSFPGIPVTAVGRVETDGGRRPCRIIGEGLSPAIKRHSG